MPDATSSQLMEINELCAELGSLRGKTTMDALNALLASKAVLGAGYDGSGRLDDAQARAAIGQARRWVEKARAK